MKNFRLTEFVISVQKRCTPLSSDFHSFWLKVCQIFMLPYCTFFPSCCFQDFLFGFQQYDYNVYNRYAFLPIYSVWVYGLLSFNLQNSQLLSPWLFLLSHILSFHMLDWLICSLVFCTVCGCSVFYFHSFML